MGSGEARIVSPMSRPKPYTSGDVAGGADASVGGREDGVLRARGIVPFATAGGNAPLRRSARSKAAINSGPLALAAPLRATTT